MKIQRREYKNEDGVADDGREVNKKNIKIQIDL